MPESELDGPATFDRGLLRPWLVLGFCPVCLRQVREGQSHAWRGMPGARVRVAYHFMCEVTGRPPWERH